jgi:hypothetical protein
MRQCLGVAGGIFTHLSHGRVRRFLGGRLGRAYGRRMTVDAPPATVADVAVQLRGFHGHRTVWIDPQGLLWHTEPEQELEALGWRYVGTFLRPDTETLELAVGRALVGRAAPRPALQLPVALPDFAPA